MNISYTVMEDAFLAASILCDCASLASGHIKPQHRYNCTISVIKFLPLMR